MCVSKYIFTLIRRPREQNRLAQCRRCQPDVGPTLAALWVHMSKSSLQTSTSARSWRHPVKTAGVSTPWVLIAASVSRGTSRTPRARSVLTSMSACVRRRRVMADATTAKGLSAVVVGQGKYWGYIDGLVRDCSNSSALAMELLQSCSKPSISRTARLRYIPSLKWVNCYPG